MATEGAKEVRGEWVEADKMSVKLANQFACTFLSGQEFILSIGQASPPILLGDEAEREEQLRQISSIPIRTIARIGMSEDRVRELIGVLQLSLENQSKVKSLMAREESGDDVDDS